MPLTFTVTEVSAQSTAATEGFIREAERVFRVQASEPCSAVQAEVATGIPGIGASHPNDSSLKAKSRKCQCENADRMLWLVTVKYDENIWYENPLSMPTQISYGGQQREEAYYKDCSDTPKLLLNTAGDPFDELPIRKNSLTVITAVKNVSHSTNYSSYAAIRDKVNSAETTIDGQAYAVGELYIEEISLSKIQVMNGVQYRVLTSTILSNPKGWEHVFESRGRRELVSGDRLPIADPETGQPIDYLWPLNENGTKKSAVSDEGFAMDFKPYFSASISSLL